MKLKFAWHWSKICIIVLVLYDFPPYKITTIRLNIESLDVRNSLQFSLVFNSHFECDLYILCRYLLSSEWLPSELESYRRLLLTVLDFLELKK